MDDFGTGYSSLSYLRSFPFDKIKIDRCFNSGLATGDDSVAIVLAIAGLAKHLGIATTADGVETRQQLQQVEALGCGEMEGFLFSPPRRIGEVTQMMRPGSRRIRLLSKFGALPRAGLHLPEAQTAPAFFALSHFRPENGNPPPIRSGACFS
jgi:hypothetical protein